jgi:hypothetical protein
VLLQSSEGWCLLRLRSTGHLVLLVAYTFKMFGTSPHPTKKLPWVLQVVVQGVRPVAPMELPEDYELLMKR